MSNYTIIVRSRLLSNKAFPGGSDGKESGCDAGDPSLIPGSGRSPGGGNGYPLQQFSFLFFFFLIIYFLTEGFCCFTEFFCFLSNLNMFMTGKSHGQKSLVDYSAWGHKESDTTEQLTLVTKQILIDPTGI